MQMIGFSDCSLYNAMKMKSLINLLCFCTLLAVSPMLIAQSTGKVGNYREMESRFLSNELTAEDSAAFLLLGEQRVRQLFDKGGFYVSNANVTSNQMYVRQRAGDHFYPPLRKQEDVDALLEALSGLRLTGGMQIALQTQKYPGGFGVVETTNSDPKFTFYLVLEQIEKTFGPSEIERVWEVFLILPQWMPAHVQPARKKVR
jgi:hypothetical protein